MLVDDDASVRRLLSLTLPDEGFAIVESEGPDAVDLARRTRPDLVFLDWRLPGARGEDLCRSSRANTAICP